MHLNNINGFVWASVGNNLEGYGKTTICGESFWIRDCSETDNGTWKGIIDNDLIGTDQHGLKLDDDVTFNPTLEKNNENGN